jgi:hypothetical protein
MDPPFAAPLLLGRLARRLGVFGYDEDHFMVLAHAISGEFSPEKSDVEMHGANVASTKGG